MDYSCKTPVALIFFNRPETFKKVFDEVKKAKPNKLFLIQDGPRNEKDEAKIAECRKIAENIDWECDVTKIYSEKNLGCGVRPMSGITAAFESVDRLIILEDDCVPCKTFFKYCDECLEKYENDNRISYISGLNHFETWDCGENDYFFTKTGAIWGWATWKRAWSEYYDYYVRDIKDSYFLNLIKKQITNKYIAKSRFSSWKKANDSEKNKAKLSYWDAQWGFVKYSQSMLVIVPKYNQICNIGDGEGSTHAQNTKVRRYRKYKTFMYIPTEQMSFPLSHPKLCVCDVEYDNLVYKCASGNPIRRKISKFLKKILGK